MTYLQRKKLAFMSIVNHVKGFVRTVTGVFPLTLANCVDEESIIDYTISGTSGGVGEYDEVSGKYKIPVTVSGKNLTNPKAWVSGVNESGFNKITLNYITSVGENYITTTLPAWSAIASEKIAISKISTIGFKVDKNQIVEGYMTFQCGVQYYDENGDKISYKNVHNGATADTEYVAVKGTDFGVPSSTTHIRFFIVSREQVVENLKLYDFYITKEKDTTFEPYHEPITTNIYLDEPLEQGKSVGYKKDKLPTVPTFKGTSILTADTTIQPSNAEVTYYSTERE